jgi:flagellar assembly protein FliH
MKDLSNKGIIPADQLDQWTAWSPGELALPLSPLNGLTVAQIEALSAAAGQGDAGCSEDSSSAGGDEDEPPASQMGYPTAAELETIHQEAWQAGHDAGLAAGQEEGRAQGLEQGYAEGLAEARERFDAAWAPLSELSRQFSLSIQSVEAELSADLLAFSIKIAERLVAAHLAVDARAIEPLLRQALGSLPATLAQGRLRVHPQDLEVARTFLEQERPETSWQWVEDAEIPRGGCLLETPSLRQDLTLPARMHAMLQALGVEEDVSPGNADESI